ncbi:MAG TPA: dihydrofolate reductase family protein [Nocardioides sp.]|uniref:dihydrofolate reductase family protein n=1 Tax=Nocardioides sp. TaxID=35761 RepID=UPI002E2EFB87|nr:dihydrofolate reductase family protein [Nocardioides sp.]HEX3929890.1 dihydrofolate reductase family protein [Nocardioides sp.]
MPYLTSDPAISLDGFIAGPDQDLEHPLGVGGAALHDWHWGPAEEENAAEAAAMVEAGAFIMGRNMFGPIRGEWNLDWKGWWGDEPPYHAPVFVLTHHERDPIEMAGGTTFHFVTDGPEQALRRATEVAGDGRISICGGASTINQFLRAGHIDELRLHVVPIVLGSGETIFADLKGLAFDVASTRSTSMVTHMTLRRRRHEPGDSP